MKYHLFSATTASGLGKKQVEKEQSHLRSFLPHQYKNSEAWDKIQIISWVTEYPQY